MEYLIFIETARDSPSNSFDNVKCYMKCLIYKTADVNQVSYDPRSYERN